MQIHHLFSLCMDYKTSIEMLVLIAFLSIAFMSGLYYNNFS